MCAGSLALGVCSQSNFISEKEDGNHFLVPETMIGEAWCLHFDRRPWEQQEGHVGIQGRIVIDFGMILGPHFESFWAAEG